MDIRDSFYQDGVSDCFPVVLGERNPPTGSYTMLATDYVARVFAQCTEATYDLNGGNGHVGRPVGSIGMRLVKQVMGRLEA